MQAGKQEKGLRRTSSKKYSPINPAVYAGKRTKTGNSTGFRFEGALFKSHPEFSGDVRAHIIAPGRMLITAEPVETTEPDPVIAAFLAFLAEDMLRNPLGIRPLDQERASEIASLVQGVSVDFNQDLGPETLLG